ncbi:TetR/AcrR family transcriptional regulator [Sphingomonas colocasiae]|uniref:TetR/AcrR family transcriptional regulator n=1 Tax=Sphingomonas colocasiae TaxID=1848973 RepID=A0ABS7PX27_9SPHN|nr:TetR/AcrR family transcriptional regulator [Sphingomonas colocasiae]MBY8825514.1 TetR/AcrR family transcriptional regulator [Sphingomonas colocasiae]
MTSKKPFTVAEHQSFDTLMMAACQVIGRHGYKGASVARIAEEAGISQGHCYKFFKSRDDILDHVIIWIMAQFENWSRKPSREGLGYLESEHHALEQFFSYQKKYPFFFRIMHEAEVETPTAWKSFADRRHAQYVDSLRSAIDSGEIRGYGPDQVDDLARFLSAVRRAIVFGAYEGTITDKIKVIANYDLFLRQALGFPI